MTRVIDREDGVALQVHWDDLGEAFANASEKAGRCSANNGTLGSQSWGGSWEDHRSKEWMERAVTRADASTMAAVDAMRAKVEDAVPQAKQSAPRRTRVRRQEVGSEINTDRFLQRNLECWDDMRRCARPARTIKIAVEYSVNCNQTRRELLPRGAALVALAEWLVANGFSVEIHGVWFVSHFYANGGDALSTMVAKASTTPLDVEALATSLCEISFARKVTLTGLVVNAAEKVGGGWGHATQLPERLVKALGYDLTAPNSIRDEAAAIRWLAETIAKLSA